MLYIIIIYIILHIIYHYYYKQLNELNIRDLLNKIE